MCLFCLLVLSWAVKSLQAFLKFIFNWSIIALVSTKYQYESATELQTTSVCPSSLKGSMMKWASVFRGTVSHLHCGGYLTLQTTSNRSEDRDPKDPPCPQWSQLSTAKPPCRPAGVAPTAQPGWPTWPSSERTSTGKRPLGLERKAQPGTLCFVLITLWP